MTFPPQQPPSPSGYQSVPPQPQTMGPGGAYGPAGMPAGHPVPGPMPVMTMSKPGTITGIQVIVWIFLAIGAVGDVFSIINMINYFNPLMVIALAYALYTTVQSLLTPVAIARGRRWAWILNLVSAIFGLAFAAVGIVFGVVFVDYSALPLLIGIVFAALNGTLLGLLCSRSARQWIMMHRMQRGEVQVAGAPGMAGVPGAAGAPQPERPARRPGSATFAVVLHGVLMALSAWAAYDLVSTLVHYYRQVEGDWEPLPLYASSVMTGGLIPLAIHSLLLLCALISGILVLRGRVGGRIFGLVWISVLLGAFGYLVFANLMWFFDVRQFGVPPAVAAARLTLGLSGLQFALLVCLYIMLFVPGVRRWTPGRPAVVMMVPAGHPGMQAPQGYAAPGPAPQQAAYRPQPPQY